MWMALCTCIVLATQLYTYYIDIYSVSFTRDYISMLKITSYMINNLTAWSRGSKRGGKEGTQLQAPAFRGPHHHYLE